MNANMASFRTYVLVMMFTLAIIAAQGQGIEGASKSSLPRVTVVNGRIEVGQTITVDVDHLSDWADTHDPRKLVPYLNGNPLTGSYPEEVNLTENRLLFHLKRTPQSRKEWENLLHEPVLLRPVTFSIGLEDQSPFDTVFDYDQRLNLTIIPKTWGIVSVIVALGLLVLLVYLAIRTNILREDGLVPGRYKPYDLGRVQSAAWFFVISTSYLGLWLITGDIETLTPSILGLMGISAVTALAPRLIGRTRTDQDQPVEASESAPSGSISRGFFTDILSDDDGYSFHRFQLVLWTVLLAIIFLCSVYDNLAIPKFGGTLMVLMGISATTYLGFEMLGRKSPSDVPQTSKEVLR